MTKERFALVPADSHPEYMSAIVQPFTDQDFDAAKLNPNTRTNYNTPALAAAKIKKLSKFASRKVILGPDGNPIGQASLMDTAATKQDLVKRLFGASPSIIREFNGYYDADGVHGDVAEFSTEVLGRMLRHAKGLGLPGVELVVSEEDTEAKNPRLIVIEHTADLPKLGFERRADKAVEDQNQVYEGLRWGIDL